MENSTNPDHGVYHSFIDGPGPCPLCSGNNVLKGNTRTTPPLRRRYYRCMDCGYNFKSLEIDTRFIVEKYPRILANLE